MSAPGLTPVAAELSRMRDVRRVTGCVASELVDAYGKFPESFHSAHEGYAVLLEEVDELWDAIKADDLPHALEEAVQVAAMAIRFIVDLTPKGGTDA